MFHIFKKAISINYLTLGKKWNIKVMYKLRSYVKYQEEEPLFLHSKS